VKWPESNRVTVTPIFRVPSIDALNREVSSVSDQASESEKAIVRMETKIEYIIKGVDEIKAEVKSK
jgi:hypothetical protein